MRTLTSKFVAAVGGVFLLSILVFSATVLSAVNGRVRSSAAEQVRHNLDGFFGLLRIYEHEAQARASRLAELPDVAAAVRGGKFEELAAVTVPLLKQSGMDYLVLTDASGRVLFRAHRPLERPRADDNISGQENVRKALLGQSSVGIEEGKTVRLSLRAGAPVRGEDGRVLGALSTGYVVSNNKLVDEARGITGASFSVFLGRERVATSASAPGGKPADAPLPDELTDEAVAALEHDPGTGSECLAAFRPIVGAKGMPIGWVSAVRSLELTHGIVRSVFRTAAWTFFMLLFPAALAVFLLVRSIGRPLSSLRELLSAVGGGDLTIHGEVRSDDDISELLATFNRTIQQQSAIVADVRRSSGKLKTASEGISGSVGSAASATHEVAECVSEVSELTTKGDVAAQGAHRVILELAKLVRTVEEKSRDILNMSGEVVGAAESGSGTVDTAVQRMERIKDLSRETEEWMSMLDENSRKISSITETITALARQTNLLALNAAIEAARAGEAGKGFAVVADEVRKLAEESNKGATEVAQLVERIVENTTGAVAGIRQSAQEVDSGVVDVRSAGESLHAILEASRKAGSAVDEIAALADKEARSADEVVRLVGAMLDVLGRTASRAQQAAKMTESAYGAISAIETEASALGTMAAQLDTTVAAFRVPSGTTLSGREAVKRAKSDHLVWRMRVDAMLAGRERVAPQDVGTHEQCRLGNWYGTAAPEIKALPEFKALDAPHRIVHDSAREAAAHYAAGDVRSAKRSAAKVAKASRKVIGLLNAIGKKLKQKRA